MALISDTPSTPTAKTRHTKVVDASAVLGTALQTIHDISLSDLRAGSLREFYGALSEIERAHRLLADALA